MFASTVEAGKLERALDLVYRLHLEKSFDLAMTIADSHRKLVDMIEEAKDRKFGDLDDDDDEEEGYYDEETESPVNTGHSAVTKRISPDSTLKVKRPFDGVPARHVKPKNFHT
jgi:hypothetical protein